MRRAAYLLALALVAASCAPATPPAASTGPSGSSTSADRKSPNQVLRVARTGLPGTATPESTALSNDIMTQHFDPLMFFAKGFELRPGVVTAWALQAPTNTWRLTIRTDLVFSNGEKVTAEDVAYSINVIVEKRLPQLATVALVQKATAVNPTTVDVQSRQLDPTLLNGLPGVFVFPMKHHQTATDFGQKPIGSGPYELAEYRPGDRMVFKLRSTPHAMRKPTFTEIRMFAIPELGQQINGLRGGELDVISGAFPVDQVNLLRNGGFQSQVQAAGVATAVFMQNEAELRNSPVQDKRVRQALNYSINRQGLATSLYRGFAEPAGQLSVPGAPAHNPALQPIPYDPARGRQLLAEAGYPNGFRFQVGLEFSPLSSSPDIATFVQASFREIGVETPVTGFEQAVFTQRSLNAREPRGDILMLFVSDAVGTWAQLPNLFDCGKQGWLRWWCNEAFDRAYLASRSEPDPVKRVEALRAALALLNDDVPYVLTVTVPNFIITASDIKQFEWTTRSFYDFDRAYRAE